MYNLFIDDERMPGHVTWAVSDFYNCYPWDIARNIRDVSDYILYQGFPKVISFDHDLGYKEPTGYDIVKHLIALDMDKNIISKDFKFFVHSKNHIGANNITKLLNNYLEFRSKQSNSLLA